MTNLMLLLALIGGVNDAETGPTVTISGGQILIESDFDEPTRVRVEYTESVWRRWRRGSSGFYRGDTDTLLQQLQNGEDTSAAYVGPVSYESPGYLRQIEYLSFPAGPHVCQLTFSEQRGEEATTLADVLVSPVLHSKPVVFIYSAEWCQPCKDLKAALHEMELDFVFEKVAPVEDVMTIPMAEWVNGDGQMVRLQTANANTLVNRWRSSQQ